MCDFKFSSGYFSWQRGGGFEGRHSEIKTSWPCFHDNALVAFWPHRFVAMLTTVQCTVHFNRIKIFLFLVNFIVVTLSTLVKMFCCCLGDERSVKTFQLIDRIQIEREQTRSEWKIETTRPEGCLQLRKKGLKGFNC